MKKLSNHFLEIPSENTPKIQEAHAVLGHILFGFVELALFKAPS